MFYRTIGSDKPTTQSPPSPLKDLFISSSGLTSDISGDRDTRSNPTTSATSHRDKLTSRLELIKQKRSRENLDMIDETNTVKTRHNKEQSDDTVDSGIGTVRIDNVSLFVRLFVCYVLYLFISRYHHLKLSLQLHPLHLQRYTRSLSLLPLPTYSTPH